MIYIHNFRAMLKHLGFSFDSQAVQDVMRKKFAQGDSDFELEVDFTQQRITYPTGQGFQVHQETLANIANNADEAIAAAPAPAQKQTILQNYL